MRRRARLLTMAMSRVASSCEGGRASIKLSKTVLLQSFVQYLDAAPAFGRLLRDPRRDPKEKIVFFRRRGNRLKPLW